MDDQRLHTEMRKWYKVVEEQGRIVGTDSQNRAIEITVRTIPEPVAGGSYTEIRLEPYYAANDHGERTQLYRFVKEHVYPSGTRRAFQSNEFVTWNPELRPEYRKLIYGAASLELSDWEFADASLDGRVQTYTRQLEGELFDEVQLDVDTIASHATYWLKVPNTTRVSWEYGYIEVYTEMQYGLVFYPTSDKPVLAKVRFKEFVI